MQPRVIYSLQTFDWYNHVSYNLNQPFDWNNFVLYTPSNDLLETTMYHIFAIRQWIYTVTNHIPVLAASVYKDHGSFVDVSEAMCCFHRFLWSESKGYNIHVYSFNITVTLRTILYEDNTLRSVPQSDQWIQFENFVWTAK